MSHLCFAAVIIGLKVSGKAKVGVPAGQNNGCLCCDQPMVYLLPVFVNERVLEQDHSHIFTYLLSVPTFELQQHDPKYLILKQYRVPAAWPSS